MDSRNEQQKGVNNFILGDQNDYFGIDPCVNLLRAASDDATVVLHDENPNGEHMTITSELDKTADKQFEDGNFGIELFVNVKRKVVIDLLS